MTTSLRRLVSTSQVFTANPQKIKCPYCGGRLIARATAWTQRDDGTWEADELQVDCDQEPDIETDFDSWDEWANVHTAEPYLNWLPVEERLKRAINAKVNFYIPERDGANVQDHRQCEQPETTNAKET